MVELGLADLLTLAQTVGIIGTMIMTLYFSKRQIQGITVDVETRVLNDLDEKRFRISELLIDDPELIRVVAGPTSGSKPEHVVSYMVALVSAHAYHMRERKIISDNEWIGWLQWMKNDFAQGTIRRDWIDLKMGQWFDPRFRDFIDKEIIASTQIQMDFPIAQRPRARSKSLILMVSLRRAQYPSHTGHPLGK